jgi:hypothetical protein
LLLGIFSSSPSAMASRTLIVAAVLVFAIVMPAVAVAQEAPAPAPTSDGESAFTHTAHKTNKLNTLLLVKRSPQILIRFLILHSRSGTSVDQCVAYLLMIVALVLTYLIHPLDASSPYKLF